MNSALARNLFLMVLMVAASLASVALIPTKRLSDQREHIDLEQAIPGSFGHWKVDSNASPILPSADTQEAVARIYDQTLSRTYVGENGKRIMLSVAYGGAQNQELRAHRQEVCYAAQGFQISQLKQVNLKFGESTVSGTRMVAQYGTRRIEPVTYWFTMGDQVVRSLLDRQMTQLKYAFTGYVPDGYLFRVSSISAEYEEAFQEQQEFADELLRHTDTRLVSKLLGSKSSS